MILVFWVFLSSKSLFRRRKQRNNPAALEDAALDGADCACVYILGGGGSRACALLSETTEPEGTRYAYAACPFSDKSRLLLIGLDTGSYANSSLIGRLTSLLRTQEKVDASMASPSWREQSSLNVIERGVAERHTEQGKKKFFSSSCSVCHRFLDWNLFNIFQYLLFKGSDTMCVWVFFFFI